MINKRKKPVSFAIIGLGRFGLSLAESLSGAGKDIIAIDKDENYVKEARRFTDYAFVAESFEQEMFEQAGIQNCDTAVVCMGEQIDTSILVTMALSNLEIPKIFAVANSPIHGEVLKKLGAKVVYPEWDMAVRLGKKLIYDNFLDSIILDGNVEVRRIEVTKKLVGVSIKDANTRGRYKLNIIAIEHDHKTDVDFPAQYCFGENDVISVIGKTENIERFENDINEAD